jgi:hypothetical protein
MNCKNRDHESTVLLTTPNGPSVELGQATTALWEDSLNATDSMLYGSEASTERDLGHSSMPIEGARPIPYTVKRQLPVSEESFALSDISRIAFDQERGLDLDSIADADVMDKSSRELSISGRPFSWQHLARIELRNWGWETGSCVCSLAVFFGMIGLLRAFDGKTQPDWPYGITINSAISSLVTMIKGFLLVPAAACISQSIWISYTMESQSLQFLDVYDSASRGPWGAIELLWALKIRYCHGCW